MSDIVKEMRLQRHGMIQTKVRTSRSVEVQSLSFKKNTLPISATCLLSLSFQEQYLFCYKVWLEVLQCILQLHGNQWQPEGPQEHKVV